MTTLRRKTAHALAWLYVRVSPDPPMLMTIKGPVDAPSAVLADLEGRRTVKWPRTR